MQSEESWQSLWLGLGATGADPALREALVQRYRESPRKYHTLQHLTACLRHFATLRARAEHPHEVEVALWFHDAVYEIGGGSNELQSADWARSAVLAAGVDVSIAQRVHALVMATCHNVLPQTRDEEVLLDVDLAILGAPPQHFDAYETQIRQEYASVPEPDFQTRRKRILQQFMDRPRIYHTAQFNALLEAQARANLARSIAALGAKP